MYRLLNLLFLSCAKELAAALATAVPKRMPKRETPSAGSAGSEAVMYKCRNFAFLAMLSPQEQANIQSVLGETRCQRFRKKAQAICGNCRKLLAEAWGEKEFCDFNDVLFAGDNKIETLSEEDRLYTPLCTSFEGTHMHNRAQPLSDHNH